MGRDENVVEGGNRVNGGQTNVLQIYCLKFSIISKLLKRRWIFNLTLLFRGGVWKVDWYKLIHHLGATWISFGVL